MLRKKKTIYNKNGLSITRYSCDGKNPNRDILSDIDKFLEKATCLKIAINIADAEDWYGPGPVLISKCDDTGRFKMEIDGVVKTVLRQDVESELGYLYKLGVVSITDFDLQ